MYKHWKKSGNISSVQIYNYIRVAECS